MPRKSPAPWKNRPTMIELRAKMDQIRVKSGVKTCLLAWDISESYWYRLYKGTPITKEKWERLKIICMVGPDLYLDLLSGKASI